MNKKGGLLQMELVKETEIQQLLGDERLSEFYPENLDDLISKECYARYRFLRRHLNETTCDQPRIYYSMYYWFIQFSKHCRERVGPDAGIEQEGFKLLEEMDYQLDEGIDWSIIEEIEQL
jgi:hypothetical protein